MDIGVLLGIFVGYPWLAIAPAALLVLAWFTHRHAIVIAAALAWRAYFPYELGMKLRLLCSGECNIRVDLLLVYPLLLFLTIAAVVAIVRRRPAPPRA